MYAALHTVFNAPCSQGGKGKRRGGGSYNTGGGGEGYNTDGGAHDAGGAPACLRLSYHDGEHYNSVCIYMFVYVYIYMCVYISIYL